MTSAEQAWVDAVQAAAASGDEAALRTLFSTARELFGADASRWWTQTLSAFDASAVTG